MNIERRDVLTILLGIIVGLAIIYVWNGFRFDVLQSIIVVFAVSAGILLAKNKKKPN